MTSWVETAVEKIGRHGAIVRAVVIRAEGSTPREAGAAMIVTPEAIEGTVGGGALELEVVTAARAMLSKGLAAPAWRRDTRDYPLGPSLGQCCGGYTKVLFEVFTEAEFPLLCKIAEELGTCSLFIRPLEGGLPPRVITHRKQGYTELPLNVLRAARDMLSGARPLGAVFCPGSKGAGAWFMEPVSRAKIQLYLYGAGHVGRALVRVLEGLPFEITWVDTSEERFPEYKTPSVTRIPAADPAAVAASAGNDAFHLVMTYSHPLDLAICHTILKSRVPGFLGLIGSNTKRARFIKRLRELGHSQASIDRLTCPIGIAGLPGKEPATIAVSVAAQLLQIAAARGASAMRPEAREVPR